MPVVWDFFLGIKRRCNSFSCRAWHTRFPLELELPGRVRFHGSIPLKLNASYAAEDVIKKSKRKLKVGGWSKFNLILSDGASRFKLKGLHAVSRMIHRFYLFRNNHEKILFLKEYLLFLMYFTMVLISYKNLKNLKFSEIFYTWKNQRLFMEFYWDSENFF